MKPKNPGIPPPDFHVLWERDIDDGHKAVRQMIARRALQGV
jgi:hypothetical protein